MYFFFFNYLFIHLIDNLFTRNSVFPIRFVSVRSFRNYIRPCTFGALLIYRARGTNFFFSTAH